MTQQGARPSRKAPFDQVVAEHGATVLRVCRAVLGRDDADDAWSETFLSALRSYPDLPGDANVGAWLVTIAHRRALDGARSRSRRPSPIGVVPDEVADRGVEGRDLDLAQAVARLPERQRHAVVYHYLGGLSYREIADLLESNESAVRRAAADGVGSLRRADLYADDKKEP